MQSPLDIIRDFVNKEVHGHELMAESFSKKLGFNNSEFQKSCYRDKKAEHERKARELREGLAYIETLAAKV